MTYRLRAAAGDDIVRIYAEGVRLFGPNQADAYQDRLFKAFDLIAALPGIARERREIEPPVRVHPCGAHLIVYVIEGEDVVIARIHHASRDWTQDD